MDNKANEFQFLSFEDKEGKVYKLEFLSSQDAVLVSIEDPEESIDLPHIPYFALKYYRYYNKGITSKLIQVIKKRLT